MEGRTERLEAVARRTYSVVLVCGAVPLFMGTLVFLLWLPTRWEWLMKAGVWIIGLGCLLFVVGLVTLVSFYVLVRRARTFSRQWLGWSTAGAVALLFVNFPAAGGFIMAAITVVDRYTLTIQNHSRQEVTDIHVLGGGREVDFGSVAPGGSRRRWFWIQYEGELTLRAVRGGIPIEKVVDGYALSGTHTVASVEPDGSVSVANADDRYRTE